MHQQRTHDRSNPHPQPTQTRRSPQARWRELAWGFAPRWEDPPRGASHYDYYLREARWLANDVAQERLWRRHSALKFAREAAAAARARLARLAPAAREAAAAALKAAAAAHKAAGGGGATRGGSKRGSAAKQRGSSAAADAAGGRSGGAGSGGGEAEPSLVAGKAVSLGDEEKAALRADLRASEAGEAAEAYGGWPR
jgi:hypothetical protein